MSKILMDEKFFEGLVNYVDKKTGLEAETDIMKLFIKSHFEHISETLADEKSEDEEVSIELPGYIEYTVAYREVEGEGSFGVGITAHEELKKRIKDDEMLTDLEEDDE